MLRRTASVLLAVVVVAGAAACGSDGEGGSDGRLRIVAGFYPLEWMAASVGGPHVEVESLATGGQEPHDLELAPRDVAALVDADAVVYLSGFQPAVDEAIDQAEPERVFDAAPSADLDRVDDEGTADPHFWLDPVRLRAVTRAFARFLSEADPTHAREYAAGRDEVDAKLAALDADLREVLASCERDQLVTSHDAFGYLATRYGMTQVGISGLTPEAEPSPADLAEVTRFVEDHDVRTFYFASLVGPDIAEALASETGARTAVLDPIEGLTESSAGDDYLAVMRANLASLRTGQPCP